MKKIIITIIALGGVGILFWQQGLEKKEIWVQIIGFAALFFVMARLSAKTPSKHQDNQEEDNQENV
ncbi:MAG: hypothetical protein QM535_11120 [Limnohabitans sp.]|nr:hypothetical protein [Limnohabitans sp.]